jgi:hypothetical protein
MIVAGLCSPGIVEAQQAFRLSEKEMKDLLKRVEDGADRFKTSLKKALSDSRFDDTRAENRINDFVKGFDKAAERLKDKFSDERSASGEVEKVLRRAARIDGFVSRNELTPEARADWSSLRAYLDELAVAYNVSWDWSRPRE